MKKTLYLLLALFLLLSCVGCTPPEAASTEQTQVKTEPAAPSSTESDPPVSSQIASPSSSETEAPASTAAQTPAASSKEEASPAASTAAKPAAQTQAKPPVTTKAKAPAQTQAKPPVTTKAKAPAQTQAKPPVTTKAKAPAQTQAKPPVTNSAATIPSQGYVEVQFNSFEAFSELKQMLSKSDKELNDYLLSKHSYSYMQGVLTQRKDVEALLAKLEKIDLVTLKESSGYKVGSPTYDFSHNILTWTYRTTDKHEWIRFEYCFDAKPSSGDNQGPVITTMELMNSTLYFYEWPATTEDYYSFYGQLNSTPAPLTVQICTPDGSREVPAEILDNLEIIPMKDLLNGKK